LGAFYALWAGFVRKFHYTIATLLSEKVRINLEKMGWDTFW
jgi:hypothetical protein